MTEQHHKFDVLAAEASKVSRRSWRFETEGKKVRRLASTGTRGKCRVAVGAEGRPVSILEGDGAELYSIPSDEWVLGLCAVSIDGEPHFVLGDSGVRLHRLEGASTSERVVLDSPVTSMVALQPGGFATGHRSGAVVRWSSSLDVEWMRSPTNREVVELVECNVLGRSEPQLAAASEEKCVSILSLEDGSEVDRLALDHWILSLAEADIYAEGRRSLLVASFEGDVRAHEGGKSAAISIDQSGILSVLAGSFVKGCAGDFIAIGTSSSLVHIYECGRPLEEVWTLHSGRGHRATTVLDRLDQDLLLVGSEEGFVDAFALSNPRNLRALVRSTCVETGGLPVELSSPTREILAPLAMGTVAGTVPTNGTQQSASYDSTIVSASRGWLDGAREAQRHKCGGRVYDLSILAREDGTHGEHRFAVGGEDGRVRVFEFGAEVATWDYSAGAPVRGVAWDESPDGIARLLVGTTGGELRLFAEDGTPVGHAIEGDWVLQTRASPDADVGTRYVAGSDGHYFAGFDESLKRVWANECDARVRALSVGRAPGCGGYFVAAGSDDRTVTVASLSTGEILRRFPIPHYALSVLAADITQDGSDELLVGTEDFQAYAYDLDGRELWSFDAGGWVAGLGFFRGGHGRAPQVVVGSADNHVYGLGATGEARWSMNLGSRVRSIASHGGSTLIPPYALCGTYAGDVHCIVEDNGDELLRAVSLRLGADPLAPESSVKLDDLLSTYGQDSEEALAIATTLIAHGASDSEDLGAVITSALARLPAPTSELLARCTDGLSEVGFGRLLEAIRCIEPTDTRLVERLAGLDRSGGHA